MAFKTFTAAPLTSSDMNTYLMKQAVIVCTSGTRPASPVQGETIYQTDTDSFKYWSGSIWDAFPGSLVATTTGANTLTSTSTEIAASSATAGLGLASVSLSSTRSYRIEISGRMSQTGTLGPVTVRVRASTGTVTTASTMILTGQAVAAGTGGAGAFDLTFTAPWTPASTATWNLAVTVVGNANSSWGPSNMNPIITLYAV